MIKIFAVLFALQTIISPVSSWEPAAEDVEAIARTLYGECRGAETVAEKEAVAWVILNRLDAGYADTVLGVVSAPGQFADTLMQIQDGADLSPMYCCKAECRKMQEECEDFTCKDDMLRDCILEWLSGDEHK